MIDDDGAAALEVGFILNTEGAFAELLRFGQMFSSETQDFIRNSARIEAAAGGIKLAGATSAISDFGTAATREGANAAREFARVEKAGESMVRQLERQGDAFGRTREQMRGIKAETAALAAEQKGLTELAERIRTAETSIYDKESAAAAKARADVAALADEKAAAAQQAAVATEVEAQAIRSAALAHAMFEARVRAGAEAMREQAAAARASEMEAHAQEIRSAARAYDMFEAAARQGAKALREEEAAQQSADRERQSAIGSADAYAAKLEGEAAALGKTSAELRAMEVAQRAAAAEAAGMPDHADRIRAAGNAYAQAAAQVEALAAEERRLAQASREAEDAVRHAAAAQAAQDSSLNSLRSSVDPLYASQRRLSQELENAARLYRAGAIGQGEYERSSSSLAGRLDEVQRAQARQAAGTEDATNKAKLGANDLTNIFFQVQDIIVSLQGGQKPLTVLLQQGSQLSGIMLQTGASAKDMAGAIIGLGIVTRPTVAAAAALTEAQTALVAANSAAGAAGTRAAIAAAELAVAEEAAAAAGTADAVAQQRLARAQLGAASSAEVAAAANAQLALAETAAGDAATAASRSATRALAPWLAAVIAIAAPLSVLGVGMYRWQQQLSNDSGLKAYAAGLGLTSKEMKKLGDQSITTGDLLGGLWKTITDSADIDISGKSILDAFYSPDDMKQVQGFVASIYGTFAGGYDAIVALWGSMSSTVSGYISAIAAAASQFFAPVVAAAQWAGKAVGSVFSTVYQWVAGWVKSIAGWISPVLSAIGKGEAATAISGAGSSLGKTFGDAYAKRVAGFVSGSNAFVDKVGANATEKAQARLKKQADALKADRTPKAPPKPKVDRHAEGLVRDAEAIEAQIRNLYDLAKAYGVSGAAALIAEARVKAESKAIKQQADITAAVSRQVQLAIAQRVSDAAKSTAVMREQITAQKQVNAFVAAGLVPAERANELIAAQIADLPLLGAEQAAKDLKLTDAAARATKALRDQQNAREDLNETEEGGRFNTDMTDGRKQLATLAEELRLVGATNDEREIGLARLKATQEAEVRFTDPARRAEYIAQQVKIAKGHQAVTNANDALNASLRATADLFDTIDQTAQRAAQGMADAFGSVGAAIGEAATIMTSYYADQASLQQAHDAAIKEAGTDQNRIARENQLFAMRTASAQTAVYGDMAAAAKGFFKEGTAGYKAMATAEKVFRAIEFAMAVKNAAVQLGLIGGVTTARTVAAATGVATDTAFTATSVVNAGMRAAADGTAAMAKTASSSPFPFNLAGMAVMAAALASLGIFTGFFGGGGGKNTLAKANDGTGTVLGDTSAQSESLKRSMDALKEVDTLTNTYARQMAASLKSIDSQIGNVAALVVRAGDVNASAGVKEGFASDTTGKLLSGIVTGGGLFSKIPVVGSIIGAVGSLIGSLFGSKTTVVGSGLYGKDQQLGSVLGGGFDASYYSDVEKKKKFLGISTGTSYSTKYTGADAGLENQFTLILKQFNDAIAASAGPLGIATGNVQARLNSFVVSIGKIDLKDLTGEQIQEKLSAVFGAAADKMAATAIPGLERFQKVGEGAFETLVRVASTVEAVGNALDLLGTATRGFSIDAKLALADQFDSVSDLTSAASAYFEAFYSKEEQAAAKTAQFAKVFDSLGMAMPASLAGFRQLVEAQDLNTAAGQSAYGTLLKLAPAFADLQSAMEGARSAADIAAERQDLERKLLELKGDTATLRALDLAKLDVSNRALQQQIWAIQDAQEATKAAEALRDAWASVGDGLMDEVKRIRGLTDAGNGNGFAALQGQFNTATSAARSGDQDAAKGLPALSQALLTAAAEKATSRQELERVRAMTAASLEATYGVISALGNGTTAPTAEQMTSRQELDRVQAMNDASRQAAYGVVSALAGGTATAGRTATPIDTMITAADAATGKAPAPANDDLIVSAIEALQEEVAGLRRENSSAQSEIARHAKGIDRKLDDVTADHNGMAFSVGNASAA